MGSLFHGCLLWIHDFSSKIWAWYSSTSHYAGVLQFYHFLLYVDPESYNKPHNERNDASFAITCLFLARLSDSCGSVQIRSVPTIPVDKWRSKCYTWLGVYKFFFFHPMFVFVCSAGNELFALYIFPHFVNSFPSFLPSSKFNVQTIINNERARSGARFFRSLWNKAIVVRFFVRKPRK